MTILSEKDGFKCALLVPPTPAHLAMFFEKYMCEFSDKGNMQLDKSAREGIHRSLYDMGPSGLSGTFNRHGHAHFILLDANNEVIGGAHIKNITPEKTPEFEGGHVHSDYKGRHLADLLYQAREAYLKQNGFERALISIPDWNAPSQKAAIRNDFQHTGEEQRPKLGRCLIFEKHFD